MFLSLNYYGICSLLSVYLADGCRISFLAGNANITLEDTALTMVRWRAAKESGLRLTMRQKPH